MLGGGVVKVAVRGGKGGDVGGCGGNGYGGFVVEVVGVSWVGGLTCWLVYMMSWPLMALMPYFLFCTQEKCHHGHARGALPWGRSCAWRS